MEAKGSTFLKVTGILMIVFGAIALIVSIISEISASTSSSRALRIVSYSVCIIHPIISSGQKYIAHILFLAILP